MKFSSVLLLTLWSPLLRLVGPTLATLIHNVETVPVTAGDSLTRNLAKTEVIWLILWKPIGFLYKPCVSAGSAGDAIAALTTIANVRARSHLDVEAPVFGCH